jgi:hypothetical protein
VVAEEGTEEDDFVDVSSEGELWLFDSVGAIRPKEPATILVVYILLFSVPIRESRSL